MSIITSLNIISVADVAAAAAAYCDGVAMVLRWCRKIACVNGCEH